MVPAEASRLRFFTGGIEEFGHDSTRGVKRRSRFPPDEEKKTSEVERSAPARPKSE
jgi:hypothetical protein